MFGDITYSDIVFVLTKHKVFMEYKIYSVRGDNIYSVCGERICNFCSERLHFVYEGI